MSELKNTEKNYNKELNPTLKQKTEDWKKQEKEKLLIKFNNDSDALQKKFLEDNDALVKKLGKDVDAVLEKKKHIYLISYVLNIVDFHGWSTRAIYETYNAICINNDMDAISDIEFSRFVCKQFGYEVVDKKRNGKKYRVFKKIQD